MRSVSVAGRVAAVGAVVVAVLVVAYLLFLSGGGYTVHAYFQNANQLVKGNQVEIGGVPAGTVDGIAITDDGQAKITLSVDDQYKPLPKGTRAVIRQASLSGIANRYVELELPPGAKRGKQPGGIPDGGNIKLSQTTTAVDLDQLFNTLDPPTRRSLKAFFANSAAEFKNKTKQQRVVYHYLNPALSTSARLFGELNRDNPLLARFLQDSQTLVNALAEKRDALASFVSEANITFRALGSQRLALAEAIHRLPDFMRQANTTFVNLRAALNDVDPLVNASKPVAPRLNRFLTQARPFARDARPTVRDLADVVLKPGPDNDLYNLQESFPALASAALDKKQRSIDFGTGPKDVGTVNGAFPETTRALSDSAPIVAFGRPYTPDLFGWFDDFSTSGPTDAEGGFLRAAVRVNLFDLSGGVPVPLNINDRLATLSTLGRTGQFKRCPGAAEEPAADGSNVYSQAEMDALDCKESARATGPVTP